MNPEGLDNCNLRNFADKQNYQAQASKATTEVEQAINKTLIDDWSTE